MRTLDVQCRLKPYKASELIFSCVRSKLAYNKPCEIKKLLTNDNLLGCTSDMRCNPIIQRKVQHMVDKASHGPIFYDGLKSNKNKRDAQGYIIWDKETIYVSYRGTCDPMDILDNIDIRQKTLFKNIKVHSGFYEQFDSIEPFITSDIKNISKEYPSIKQLVFTGHSLGGSVTSIASPYYGQMFKDRFKIVSHTLGSAPCGNIDFVNWFNSNVDENVRLETEGDIVPYIQIHDDFYHVPNGILIKKDGTLVDQYEIKPYNYFKLASMLINKKTWEQINLDHSCEAYISRLFALDEMISHI